MKFLFWDCGGLHSSTADKVGSEGHEVFYYVPWNSAYPKFVNYAPGTGLENIKKVMDPGPYYDQVDCIVFPDVGAGGTAAWLRSKGHTVFGAGLGEEMEQDRIKSVEVMNKQGVKCPETKVFHGIPEVMEFIESELGTNETNQMADGKYFVKFNVWRGDCESFPVESVEQAKDMFSKLRSNVGPYADVMPIIVQSKSEGVETGFDGFFTGKEFIKPLMVGCESGGSYVGYVTDDLGFMGESANKVAEYFESVGYRGAFSTELFHDGKDCSWIDFTCRLPLPLGLLYSKFIPNWGEFIHSVASGESPKTSLPKGKYLGVSELSSENAIGDWLSVSPNEHTILMRPIIVNGQHYSVPGISSLGVVTGQGDDFSSLKKDLDKNAEGASAYFGRLDTNFLDGVMDKYINPIAKINKEGVKVFGPGARLEKSVEKKPESLSRAKRLVNLLEW